MRLKPRDPLFQKALGTWSRVAPEINLNPAEFQPELIWQKTDPGRSHVVIRLDGEGRSLVLKQIFETTDLDRALQSLAAQSDAADRLAPVAKAHAPGVHYASADGAVSVMAFARGKTLDGHLVSGKTPAPLLRRAGAWLDAFHRTGQDSTRMFQPRFMTNHAARMAQSVRDGSMTVPSTDLFLSCADAIPRIAKEFAGRQTVSAAKHGDFNLRNILLGPAGETGIDFHPHQTAPVGFDISRLLLDYAQIYGPRDDLIPGTVLPSDAADAFFKGYRLVTLDDPSVGFLPFVQLLNDWRAIPARLGKRSWRQAARLSGVLRLARKGFADWI